jgi:hypothetical protein
MSPLPRSNDLDAAVDRFIKDNPHVWEKFRLLAMKLKVRGHTRWSAKNLFEVLRWDHAISTNEPADAFLLNNSYTSRFARRLMDEDEFEGFFETRTLKSKHAEDTRPHD